MGQEYLDSSVVHLAKCPDEQRAFLKDISKIISSIHSHIIQYQWIQVFQWSI